MKPNEIHDKHRKMQSSLRKLWQLYMDSLEDEANPEVADEVAEELRTYADELEVMANAD